MLRIHPAWLAFGGSCLLFAALTALLAWDSLFPPRGDPSRPVVLHCAAALQAPLKAIADRYQQEYGLPIEVRGGASQDLLARIQIAGQGDLFLPADEVYLDTARERGLLAEVIPLARMRAVVVQRTDAPRPVVTWADLTTDGVRLVQANPEVAAVGRLTRERLRTTGRWTELERRTHVFSGTVVEAANAVKLGSADAAVVWDAVAAGYPELKAVALPELAGVVAAVRLAVLRGSEQPAAALRFARYVAAADRGLPVFREHGFSTVEEGDPFDAAPELVAYLGAVLRPAVEETIREFEEREGVRVTRVYNGCGILVAQMRGGERPDLFFACDPQFMNAVRDRFDPPAVASSNRLGIAVRRDNAAAQGLRKLADLARPGLRVGVGHEHQCALGALTREALEKSGAGPAVAPNVVVQSPTGDLLVNQLRAGSLDAAVVYRSNALPHAAELAFAPVEGVTCANPEQPVAVARGSGQRHLAGRLQQALLSAESRRRFEEQGFGWKGPN